MGRLVLTEADTRVLSAHVVALLVREEHVCGETTLGCVGVWRQRALANGSSE